MQQRHADKMTDWDLHTLYTTHVRRRYHVLRDVFYERLHRVTGVLSLFFSIASVAMIGNEINGALYFVMGIGVAQALDVGLGFRNKSLLHKKLSKRYLSIESDLSAKGFPILNAKGFLINDYQEIIEIIQKRIKETKEDEPDIIKRVMIKAHRDVFPMWYFYSLDFKSIEKSLGIT